LDANGSSFKQNKTKEKGKNSIIEMKEARRIIMYACAMMLSKIYKSLLALEFLLSYVTLFFHIFTLYVCMLMWLFFKIQLLQFSEGGRLGIV
jgi:hypothetical protein